MILTHLELRNFRSYSELQLDFAEGLNLILGPNAVGKSNLAEAIHYLSLARSWRSQDDRLLIKDGCESALIRANVSEGGLTRQIEIEIARGHKRIAINGKNVRRISELSKLVNVIVFAPSDVGLFVNSPGERRNFLDVALSKQSLDYFSLISRYNRLLLERNAALKRSNVDLKVVEVLTQQMIEVAEPLVKLRHMYVNELNRVLPDLIHELRDPASQASIVYHPFVKDDGAFAKTARQAFKEALESDLLHRSTSIGPHREDFQFRLNGKNVADYGSQGENRLAVLSLKLAPYFLIEDADKKPICVLDDATSELDPAHQKALVNFAKEKLHQVFITATTLEIEGASIIDVSANKAIRRK
jgi:DNA replication and repair protein RecF